MHIQLNLWVNQNLYASVIREGNETQVNLHPDYCSFDHEQQAEFFGKAEKLFKDLRKQAEIEKAKG